MRETPDQSRPAASLGDQGSSDAQIFFAAVLGLAGVLLTHWLLVGLVTFGAAAGEETQTLVSRLGPASTILPFSVFLVFVPALLAFLAIGLPFAMRTLAALFRRSLRTSEALALLGLAACVAVAAAEIHSGGNGIFSLAIAALISALGSAGVLGRSNGTARWRLLAAAGLALLGLGYYEHVYIHSARLSMAVAPTLLLLGFFLLSAALLLTSIAEFRRPGGARLATLLAWLIAIGWYAAPRLRPLAASSAVADQLEFCVTVAAGVMLLILGLANGRRS